MTKEEKNAWRREYYAKNREGILKQQKARTNTEEYRAERRRRYREKHKDDPITPRRLQMRKYSRRCDETTLAERRAKKQALRDIAEYKKEEREKLLKTQKQ